MEINNILDNIYIEKFGNGYYLMNISNLKTCFMNNDDFVEFINSIKNENFNPYNGFIYSSPKYKEDNSLPISITINTGYICNYSCDFCFEKKIDITKKIFSEDKIEYIDKFYEYYCEKYGIKKDYGEVALIGGEPFLDCNRNLLEKVFELWDGKKIIITTNGVNVLDYKEIIKSGSAELHISLDGIRDIHYLKRHPQDKNFFDKTIEAVKWLINNNIRVIILSLYFPEYEKYYSDFFDLLENMGWLKNQNLSLKFNICREQGADNIDKGYLDRCHQSILSLCKRDKRILCADLDSFAPGFGYLLDRELCGMCDIYRCNRLNGSNYTFTPDGKVYMCTCTYDEQTCVGSFYPNIEIYENNLKKIRRRNILEMDNCKSCKLKLLCRGGCPGTVVESGKDILNGYCGVWKGDKWKEYFSNLLKLNSERLNIQKK